MHVAAKPNRQKPPSFVLLTTNPAANLHLLIQLVIIQDLCGHLHVYREGTKGPVTCTDPIGGAKDLL